MLNVKFSRYHYGFNLLFYIALLGLRELQSCRFCLILSDRFQFVPIKSLQCQQMFFFLWGSTEFSASTNRSNPPSPNLKLGTMRSDKYRSPGKCQTQNCPSDCQMKKLYLSLQRMILYCSRVQCGRALHHCIFWWCMAWMHAWKPIPWSSLGIDTMNSLEVFNDWLCRNLNLFALCDLSLCGWVAVASKHFHIFILRSKTISRLDLLHRWHPSFTPKFTDLLRATHFFSQMFVNHV